MNKAGESNAIDFSFEELEFIDEGVTTEVVNKAEEEGTTIPPTTEVKATSTTEEGEEGESNKEEKKKEDTTEGKSPESVSSKSTEDKNSGDGAISPLLYQALTDDLREQGVLSSVDESSLKDIKGVEGLIKVIKSQIKAEELKDLTDTQKLVLDDMRKGVNETAASNYKNAIDNLNSLDQDKITDDKQVRFDLIYQDFLAKGFVKDKAAKFANRSFELKEDLTDAIEAKESLITAVTDRYNKTKQSDIDLAKSKADKISANKIKLKSRILDTEEILKGMTAPENLRKEIYSDMVKTISNNPDTGIPENALMKYKRENPLDYSHKLYYLFKVTDGFKNLDYFHNKKISKKTSNLESALRESSHVVGGGDPRFLDDINAHILDIGELVIPE